MKACDAEKRRKCNQNAFWLGCHGRIRSKLRALEKHSLPEIPRECFIDAARAHAKWMENGTNIEHIASRTHQRIGFHMLHVCELHVWLVHHSTNAFGGQSMPAINRPEHSIYTPCVRTWDAKWPGNIEDREKNGTIINVRCTEFMTATAYIECWLKSTT